jgi:hypothetical protein
MTKKELEEYLFKEPFEPFRIRMSDGTYHDIQRPGLAVPTDTRLFLALPDGGWTLLVLRQVTSLEDVRPNGQGRGRSKKRRGR